VQIWAHRRDRLYLCAAKEMGDIQKSAAPKEFVATTNVAVAKEILQFKRM